MVRNWGRRQSEGWGASARLSSLTPVHKFVTLSCETRSVYIEYPGPRGTLRSHTITLSPVEINSRRGRPPGPAGTSQSPSIQDPTTRPSETLGIRTRPEFSFQPILQQR